MSLTPEQIADGWIEHDGGPMPCDPWQPITILLRLGDVARYPDSRGLDWEHTPDDDIRHPTDIIAYRPEPVAMNQIDDKSEGALQQAARATAAEPVPVSALRDGIANAALSIPIADDLDPNAVGEFLLSIFNQSGRWGYSTHDFQRGNFREVRGLPPLIARTLCCGCWANTPGEGDRVQWWRSDEMGLDVFLYWDGDGTIVIQHRNWTLENSDCKKANEWEWVNLDHWSSDLPPGYYEDDAQGMETRQGGAGTAPSQDDSPVACDAPNPHQGGHNEGTH